MKKIHKRENRVVTKFEGVSKTDQSYKKSSDINVMVSRFMKTGVPMAVRHGGRFADVSDVKSLSEMYELSNLALEAFQSLPARVRKLMNNDPSKLEEFISDEKNYDLCVEHGLIIKKEEPKAPEPQKVVIVEDASKKES